MLTDQYQQLMFMTWVVNSLYAGVITYFLTNQKQVIVDGWQLNSTEVTWQELVISMKLYRLFLKVCKSLQLYDV